MKTNKRIINVLMIIILMICIFPLRTYAERIDCYYMDEYELNKYRLIIITGKTRKEDEVTLYIERFLGEAFPSNATEKILNWTKSRTDYNATADAIYEKESTAHVTCPNAVSLSSAEIYSYPPYKDLRAYTARAFKNLNSAKEWEEIAMETSKKRGSNELVDFLKKTISYGAWHDLELQNGIASQTTLEKYNDSTTTKEDVPALTGVTTTCYYKDTIGENRIVSEIKWGQQRNDDIVDAHIVKYQGEYVDENENDFNIEIIHSRGIINWVNDKEKYSATAEAIYDKNDTNQKNAQCPPVLTLSKTPSEYVIIGFKTTNDANNWIKNINKANVNSIILEKTSKAEYVNSFGKIEIVKDPTGLTVTCDELLGDVNDPKSIAYIIDKIMSYVRIIVPILVITLGIIDFAKATLAGKEDEMKKAQASFIKRVIIGICVFFIPVVMTYIMELADFVWEENNTCTIEELNNMTK